MSINDTPEFWESAFTTKGEMWGQEPANSALKCCDLFLKNGVANVLIPGIGYGRNAKPFLENGMKVTGIEISPTAIDFAARQFSSALKIHQGSVTDMPFDEQKYDGIFCYGLIHLLDANDRRKLIRDCYEQLAANGMMIFTTITKASPTYGHGTLIEKDRYAQFGGVTMFFHDRESIAEEFWNAGLEQVSEIQENFPFYFIVCRKGNAEE